MNSDACQFSIGTGRKLIRACIMLAQFTKTLQDHTSVFPWTYSDRQSFVPNDLEGDFSRLKAQGFNISIENVPTSPSLE